MIAGFEPILRRTQACCYHATTRMPFCCIRCVMSLFPHLLKFFLPPAASRLRLPRIFKAELRRHSGSFLLPYTSCQPFFPRASSLSLSLSPSGLIYSVKSRLNPFTQLSFVGRPAGDDWSFGADEKSVAAAMTRKWSTILPPSLSPLPFLSEETLFKKEEEEPEEVFKFNCERFALSPSPPPFVFSPQARNQIRQEQPFRRHSDSRSIRSQDICS